MIYNLVAYLKTQYPLLNFVVNGWAPDSPTDSIMVRERGGPTQHFYNRTDYNVQVMSRSKEMTVARTQIQQVYSAMKNKFGIELPSVTVDGTLFAAVKTYQISPVEAPGAIGADESNLEMFSLNLVITTD
jgi:hypothetical protein